jgi:hypothetical protein
MSKKNNKGRQKAYVEFLKELERKREEDRLKNQQKREVNRMTKDVTNAIEDITINLEKEEKMDLDRGEIVMKSMRVSQKKRKIKKQDKNNR